MGTQDLWISDATVIKWDQERRYDTGTASGVGLEFLGGVEEQRDRTGGDSRSGVLKVQQGRQGKNTSCWSGFFGYW